MAARRQVGRAGRLSGQSSPTPSSCSQHAASLPTLDAAAVGVAGQIAPATGSPRTASSLSAASFTICDRPPQPDAVAVVAETAVQQPQRRRFNWTARPAVVFLKKLATCMRNPVAVADWLLWLLLLPLDVLRRTVHSPGAMTLIRVSLEAAAELLLAAMFAGVVICMAAMHVLADENDGAKRVDLQRRPCCRQPALTVDAAGEKYAAGESCTQRLIIPPGPIESI